MALETGSSCTGAIGWCRGASVVACKPELDSTCAGWAGHGVGEPEEFLCGVTFSPDEVPEDLKTGS